MAKKEACRAVKRNGERCGNKPQIAGFCRVHYPKPAPSRLGGLSDRMKTAGQIIAVSGGAVKLIEAIVHLWQSLPFGSAPQMPPDYTYLTKRIKIDPWRGMPERIIPFNKGPNTIDWRQARAVYDCSLAILEQAADPDRVTDAVTALESSIVALLDDMQSPFRDMLLQELGAASDDEADEQ